MNIREKALASRKNIQNKSLDHSVLREEYVRGPGVGLRVANYEGSHVSSKEFCLLQMEIGAIRSA